MPTFRTEFKKTFDIKFNGSTDNEIRDIYNRWVRYDSKTIQTYLCEPLRRCDGLLELEEKVLDKKNHWLECIRDTLKEKTDAFNTVINSPNFHYECESPHYNVLLHLAYEIGQLEADYTQSKIFFDTIDNELVKHHERKELSDEKHTPYRGYKHEDYQEVLRRHYENWLDIARKKWEEKSMEKVNA